MSSSNPRRMDAPDEWFGSAGSPSARFAGDADHFHHGARRSVSAPDRSRCGSFRLSYKALRRRDSSGAGPESESDVALRAVPRFWGPARPRPEPPDKVTWLEARRVLLLYIERERKGGRAGSLWTSATEIIKLTRNWPALASGSTLDDRNSLCLRSPRRAPLHQCDAVLDFGPICARRSVCNCQRVGNTKVNNHIYI